eukprot:10701531-Heterocapsa_arctica.AAC.1
MQQVGHPEQGIEHERAEEKGEIPTLIKANVSAWDNCCVQKSGLLKTNKPDILLVQETRSLESTTRRNHLRNARSTARGNNLWGHWTPVKWTAKQQTSNGK